MNDELLKVIHDEAHRFGIGKLSGMMGISERMLYNKLNPHTDEHNLTVVQLMQLITITGSAPILGAMGRAAGLSCTVSPAPVAGDLVMSVIKASKESGDVLAVFNAEAADGNWSLADAQRLESEANEAITALGNAVASSYEVSRAGGRFKKVA